LKQQQSGQQHTHTPQVSAVQHHWVWLLHSGGRQTTRVLMVSHLPKSSATLQLGTPQVAQE
jgi:hypothetical protein